MRELFVAFLQEPTLESYAAVRDALIAHEAYRPYANDLDRVNALVSQDQHQEAIDLLGNSMPNLLLSPMAHIMSAYLHDKLGDKQTSEMEAALAHRCIEGILLTGDGSAERPFLVTRVSDEYDVLRHLDKQMEVQSLTERNGRMMDRMTIQGGEEIWFDISDFFGRVREDGGLLELSEDPPKSKRWWQFWK